MSRRQLCTFVVDGLYFGVDVLLVQEVIRGLEMTRVPLAPQAIHGLINLRGHIVTAIDLRTRLGLRSRPEDLAPINLVLRTDDDVVSLLVDEGGDVIEVSDTMAEPRLDTLEGPARDLLETVYQLPERLLLVLDVVRTLELDRSGGVTACAC